MTRPPRQGGACRGRCVVSERPSCVSVSEATLPPPPHHHLALSQRVHVENKKRACHRVWMTDGRGHAVTGGLADMFKSRSGLVLLYTRTHIHVRAHAHFRDEQVGFLSLFSFIIGKISCFFLFSSAKRGREGGSWLTGRGGERLSGE